MRTAASSSSGLLMRTFVEITNLYLDGVLHLQRLPSGSVPCLPTMVAKKLNWLEPKERGQPGPLSLPPRGGRAGLPNLLVRRRDNLEAAEGPWPRSQEARRGRRRRCHPSCRRRPDRG